MSSQSGADLKRLYETRFSGQAEYRQKVWAVLCAYFSRWVPADGRVLDLGCGYCEFINTVAAREKYGMDLNPDAQKLASSDVRIIQQDCSLPWEVGDGSLDAIFTSNFFEHLPDKGALERTLKNAYIALRPGGRIIMMGPNIKYVPGAYWDFIDHYIPLTELSLSEVLKKTGFAIDECIARFLPYSMSQGRTYPVWMLKSYLATPLAWPLFGKQFLLVAHKQLSSENGRN